MIALIYLATLGAVFFPSTVTGCTISSAQIKAFYGTDDGFWRIQLAWSIDFPDCLVHLEEQVDGKEKFQIVDSESKTCTKGNYCYFKTSKQCCSNDKMQYKSMKFSTGCSCKVATFTFTIQSLLSSNSSRNCEYIIPSGTHKKYPVKVENMVYKRCGEPCAKIERNCPAVGCYCKDGYTLNTTTGKCSKIKETVVSSSQIKAYYGTGDGFWRIQLDWSKENPDCKVYLEEQVDGREKFQIVNSTNCTKGEYCYFNTSKQCCSNGTMQYKSMKFSTECSCHNTSSNFNFTIQSLLSSNSSRNCEYIIPPGTTKPEKVDNMEFKECGKLCSPDKLPKDCLASGCYCKGDVRLNLTTGLCSNIKCKPDHERPTGCEKVDLDLSTPECVKLGEFVQISWNTENNRNYAYTFSSSGNSSILTGTVPGSRDEFKVVQNRGTLALPTAAGLPSNNYTIEVVDLSSDNNCSENGSFSIRSGCQPPIPLDIDGENICVQRISNLQISWKVEEGRQYHYSIIKEHTIENESTVPGFGSDGFPVDNGTGLLMLKLDPGDYTVRVQDLDAGVKNYYTESKNFSVKACNFEIETSNCVEKGQMVTVFLLAFPDRTYEFSVLVENTSQAVLSGSFPSGVSQNGVMATYDLDSSDSLPVGRYSVVFREVETGGEGYGRFDINSYGKIGANVKYRVNPLPDGLYVCLDPRKGLVFAGGLSYKINDGNEYSLYGRGMCLEEAYGGGQGTLEITVKKAGEMAGRVDIDYVG